ncbi:regulatory protein, luxR family [Paenibacillaceae bacterium GAS479]|nr:regulatory protein, luxR family [Paenibacillaceae bacterium GAS479]
MVFDLDEIPGYTIPQDWVQMSFLEGIDYYSKKRDARYDSAMGHLIAPLASNQLNARLAALYPMMKKAKKEINGLIDRFPFPWFFILTDQEGIIMDIYGPATVKERLNQIEMKPGASLSMHHAGVNAVSVSILTSKKSCVQYKEHEMDLFHQFVCLCCPIRLNGQIVGYLDLSHSYSFDIEITVPLMEMLVQSVERILSAGLASLAALDRAKLTPREKDVAHLWVQGRTANEIGWELGITEGTVRNMVKKIYVKTYVKDKAEFVRRFYKR